MLIDFFLEVRRAKVPASLRELLDLLEALQNRLAFANMEEFYYLARVCLVKDERHLDRFDRVFGHVFKGLEAPKGEMQVELPEEWLRKLTERKLITSGRKAKEKTVSITEEGAELCRRYGKVREALLILERRHLIDILPRSANVYASGETCILAFPKQVLTTLFVRVPRAQMTLVLNIARNLSLRLREANARIVELSRAGSAGRG